jgi:hypothetical protein
VAPVSGITLEVRDGKDEHAVRLVRVENGVRERFPEVASHFTAARHAAIEIGCAAYLGDEAMDRIVVATAECLAFCA